MGDILGTAHEWRTPIKFYGRAVDENGMPIPGAGVEFSWTDLSLNGTSKSKATTGLDGAFALSDVKGYHLIVTVSHSNYYSTQSARQGFTYGGADKTIVANPNQVIDFQLIKKGEAQPLLTLAGGTRSRQFSVERGGAPLEISLKTGRVAKEGEGDLIIRRWVDINTQLMGTPYDWKYQLSIRDGGIMISSNAFNFLAPTTGYLPEVEYGKQGGEPEWTREGNLRVFVKLGDGNFGRLELKFFSHARESDLVLNAFVNTNGAPNLDFDPALNNGWMLR